MASNSEESPESAYERLGATFRTGKTQALSYRLSQLHALEAFVRTNEGEAEQALSSDMGRPRHETFLGTLVPVYIEMDHFQKSLWRLMRPRVLSRQMNGTLREIATPKGVVVIYAPSNFPIMLAIRPLAAAIAAGNCVLLKASEHAPACERFLMRLRDVLDKDSFAVVTGDAKIAQRISSLAWDHVMFTGSAAVGKLVMKAAAEHLTPITLELGGKSPAVVTASADIPTTARSIAQSRFINAGQVCLSTDYCLIEETVYNETLKALVSETCKMYKDDPKSAAFGRLSPRQFPRVQALLRGTGGRIVHGGETDESENYIAPTIVELDDADDVLMSEEIFGPVLPLLKVPSVKAAVEAINQRAIPLALYIFARDVAVVDAVMGGTRSGNVCVNDTVVQILSRGSSLAGCGESGLGGGHGFDEGFYTFSHRRLVLYSTPILAKIGSFAWDPQTTATPISRALCLALFGVGLAGRLITPVGATAAAVTCLAADAVRIFKKVIQRPSDESHKAD